MADEATLPAAAELRRAQLHVTSPLSISLRLTEALNACSTPFEARDFTKSDEALAAVVGLLDSIITTPEADSDIAGSSIENAAEEALVKIHEYLSSPSSNQMVVDALSLELPKVVAKFASLSLRCREIVGSIIDCVVSVCNPRDMLLILCEALDTSEPLVYYIPLLSGLSKVFLCIQRHHVKQVKRALPTVLNILNSVPSKFDEEDEVSIIHIFAAAISIGNSIQAICQNLVERKGELCAILGLYVLQNIALVTKSRVENIVSRCSPLVVQFLQFLPFCGLSYLGLITGCDVAAITGEVSEVDGDDFMDSFSLVMDGASLAFIWAHIFDEVAKATAEQLSTVRSSIQNNQTKRWQAVGMIRFSLSVDYPWEIKSRSIDFLFSIMDECTSEDSETNHIDFSSFMPSLFAALQAIQRVMTGASNASLRKKAFGSLRKVVSDLPCSERLDMLKALITNSNSPSMTAILIDVVREEMLVENRQKNLPVNGGGVRSQKGEAVSPFWNSEALDLVSLVLKPPEGGPPCLPEQTEPVLAALNLFRFILMVESSGGTNHTGVLSEKILRRAYSEWLLPLRTLVSGIQAGDDDDFLCALNPVQLVLYRCIELVEESQVNLSSSFYNKHETK